MNWRGSRGDQNLYWNLQAVNFLQPFIKNHQTLLLAILTHRRIQRKLEKNDCYLSWHKKTREWTSKRPTKHDKYMKLNFGFYPQICWRVFAFTLLSSLAFDSSLRRMFKHTENLCLCRSYFFAIVCSSMIFKSHL